MHLAYVLCREDKETMVHQVLMESRETQVRGEVREPEGQMDKRWATNTQCMKAYLLKLIAG